MKKTKRQRVVEELSAILFRNSQDCDTMWEVLDKRSVQAIEGEQQLNCYAYLLNHAGFPVKSLRIVAILRDGEASLRLSMFRVA